MNYFYEGKMKITPRHIMVNLGKNKENLKTAIEVMVIEGKQKWNIGTPKLPMSRRYELISQILVFWFFDMIHHYRLSGWNNVGDLHIELPNQSLTYYISFKLHSNNWNRLLWF